MALQSKKKLKTSKLTMEASSFPWWVRSHSENNIGKSSQNSPIPASTEMCSTPCVLCLYIKVVSHYDLSVLSMSVIDVSKQKSLDGGWVGCCELYSVYF